MAFRGRNNLNFDRHRQNNQNMEDYTLDPRRNFVGQYASGDAVRSYPTNPPSNKIFVTHFPVHYEEIDLTNIFNKIGTITDAKIVKKDNEKRYGFLAFTSVEEAVAAVKEFHFKPPMNLVVNFAINKDDSRSTTSNDDENRNASSPQDKNKTNHQYQRCNNSPSGNTLNISMESSCICCGRNAACKCAPCGTKYCSAKCQNEDWPKHKEVCSNKPPLIPLLDHNIGAHSENSYNRTDEYPNREVEHAVNHTPKREPSVRQIVKEITAEYKQSSINKSTVIQNVVSMSPEVNHNDESPKMVKSPMMLLLNKLKKAKTPPKKPWEETEVLQIGKFIEVSVVHVHEDSPIFYASLMDKEQVSLDIITKANDEEAELQAMTIIEVGALCLVSSDDVVYRAIVQTTSPYKLRLLEFGYSVTASEENIFEAPEFFKEFPAQAICMIAVPGGLKNTKVEIFDNVLVKYTGEITGNACVVQFSNEEYKQQNPSTEKKLSVSFQNASRELLNTSLESAINFKTFNGNVRTPPTLTRSSTNIAPRGEWLATDWKRTSVLPYVYTKVYVTYVDDKDTYVNLFSNMHNIANPQLAFANNSKKSIMHNISPGRICIVPFEGLMYRAKILSVNPVRATLLDYGNTITISNEKIFCATNTQASSESQAIHVRQAPGPKRILHVEDEVNMKTIDKEGDIYIVQIEDDNLNPSTTTNHATFAKTHALISAYSNNLMEKTNSGTPEKPKKHALDYLQLNTYGRVLIRDRPCSNKFCLNLSIPELSTLHKKLSTELQNCMKKNAEIKNPNVNDDVIIDMKELYRGKVLSLPKDNTVYVSLTDLGKIVRVTKLFLLPKNEEQFPSLAILGRLLKINGSKDDFESAMSKNAGIEFQVSSIDKTVAVECRFTNIKGISFIMELSPWKPVFEQLRHGKIFFPELTDCSVMITYFQDQNSVFVREYTTELDNKYEKNLLNIARYAHTARPLLTTPMINEIVLAKYSDGIFYKGIVKEIKEEKVTICYLAYGNTETVELKDLRELCDEFKNVNLFVRKVGLAEVPQEVLTPTVVNMMAAIISNSEKIEFEMTLDRNEKNKVYLTYPDGKSLNKQLAHLLTPIWQDVKNLSIEQAKDELINQQVLMRNLIKPATIPVGNDIELFIVDITNLAANVFFACSFDQDAMIAMLMHLPERLKEYATAVNIPYNPRINELCIAQFDEQGGNKAWFRGYCLSHEAEDCYIAAVDMGIMQYINIKNIRRMTKDFIELPALPVVCSIQDMPENPLPAEILQVLKREFIPCEAVIKFSKVIKEDDGGYSVRLPKHLLALLAS